MVDYGAAMGETLDALRRLQEVELQLAAIRQRRDVKSRRYENQQRKANQAQDGLDTHHSDKAGITMHYLDGTQSYLEPGKPAVRSRWRDESEGVSPYYQVPYRSLVPKGAKNVLVAGRLTDADKEAYGAVRVMMNCNQTGEAAGVACAIALDNACDVADISTSTLRAKLREGGSVIP